MLPTKILCSNIYQQLLQKKVTLQYVQNYSREKHKA